MDYRDATYDMKPINKMNVQASITHHHRDLVKGMQPETGIKKKRSQASLTKPIRHKE